MMHRRRNFKQEDAPETIRRVLLAWLIGANALALIGATGDFSYWVGSPLLWATLMPGACLAALYPRRSIGLILALACLPWVLLARLGTQRFANV